MSFLFELRDLARRTPDVLHRKLLVDASDAIAEALFALNEDPTHNNARTLGSVWAHGLRRWNLAKEPPKPPTDVGGKMEAPERQKLAA